MGDCGHCGRKLKESVYSSNGQMKSCPKCSDADGTEHVLWPLEEFGESSARVTPDNPKGIQSYCAVHRAPQSGGLREGGTSCSSVGSVQPKQP